MIAMTDKKDEIKNPIDVMQERMDKQDETIAELKKTFDSFSQMLNKNMPNLIDTINKQSELLNKHNEAITNIESMLSAMSERKGQAQPQGQPQQNVPMPMEQQGMSGMPDWLSGLVNLGLNRVAGPKPTGLDQMVYNIVPEFFGQMFNGMISQMNLVNQLLAKRVGGEVAKAIGVETGEALGGFTK